MAQTASQHPDHNQRPPLTPEEARAILLETRKLLAFHQSLGIGEYPLCDEYLRSACSNNPQTHGLPASPQAGSLMKSKGTLEEIRRDLENCKRCRLHETRHHLIFGKGEASARLFIVVEGPTERDDQEGIPLSAEAGELLDRMLTAIKMDRKDVYITGLVKCRPPGNRHPEKEEINICLPFLYRQIAAVTPKAICAMGPLAAQTLLATSQPLFRLRGRFHDMNGTPLMPTFHPDYLISNPEMKKATWMDLQIIQKRCGK